MSAHQTRAALVQALVALEPVALAVQEGRFEQENVQFTPPAQGSWYSVAFMPNPGVAIECGSAGEDEITGVFQVTASIPRGQGEAAGNTMLAPVEALFKLGTHFTYEGQDVLVTSAGRGPGFVSEQAYSIPFSVFFEARYPRNNPTHA